MAESIKTVGLNKTYDNFQAWEDDADDNSTTGTPWWAEFYSGADLGALIIAGWSDPPTAEAHRIKLYVASGHQHNGISGGATSSSTASATLIDLEMSFVTLDGLHADQNATGTNDFDILMGNADVEGTTVERCLIKSVGGYCVISTGGGGASHNIRNNIMINGGAGAVCKIQAGSTHPVFNVYHNIFTGAGSGGYQHYGIQSSTTKGGLVTMVVENNISFDNDDGDYALAGTSITANNNISSDATADDDGGAGHQIDVDVDDIFVDPDNGDFTPKSSSPARHAGKTISAVTVDILGTSRESGYPYDVGAISYVNCAMSGLSAMSGSLTPTSAQEQMMG